MRVLRSLGLVVLGLGIVAGGLLIALRDGAFGEHVGPGTIEATARQPEAVALRSELRRDASQRLRGHEEVGDSQILFGDLHVHSSFSADAFLIGLPLVQGEGVHPPADACDFARFCSALDFWAISDHAEQLTPQHWQETIDSVRQCEAVAGGTDDPDLISFLGWEWTQIGATPDSHYGHKNVILRGLEADEVPSRPIGAGGLAGQIGTRPPPLIARVVPLLLDWPRRRTYLDLGRYQQELLGASRCEPGIDVRSLPDDCMELADTPKVLFEKLDQWGMDALVIPHGTTWGAYTPPGKDLLKELERGQHDPNRQTLIEVYSGHGNSEQYRSWQHVTPDAQDGFSCPEPTPGFEPCCWRAGELIRARCADAPAEVCNARVRDARQNYVDAGVDGMSTVPGAKLDEWLGCGYDRELFTPAEDMRPKGSVQYSLAIGEFSQSRPQRFRWGFVGSSDSHTARPGTGYKEKFRHGMTDSVGARTAATASAIRADAVASRPRGPESWPADRAVEGIRPFSRADVERQASYFLTGGLAAVHAEGRDRGAIWDAFGRREVYATSGPKILLWFDLLNASRGRAPMGSEAHTEKVPWFRVRAAGAFKQKPGCPDEVTAALSPERLERLCKGECENPGDERNVITRIEIVRILPQRNAEESVDQLIQDPWLRLACDGRAEGCVVNFRDPDFQAMDRDVIYYARAIQEPTDTINAAAERCEYDSTGNCIAAHPCYGDYRTDAADDCLSPAEQRAWSSPIYLRKTPAVAAQPAAQ